jgi:hypothetical protein
MNRSRRSRIHRASAASALLTGVVEAVDSAFGWTAARRLAIQERSAPVYDYLRLALDYSEKLAGILGTWGSDALMTEDVRQRASRVINHEMVDRLARPGLHAREAAEAIDAELAKRLDDAERVEVAIIGLFNTTPVGQAVAPLLRHVAEIRLANARVAERLRQLQT